METPKEIIELEKQFKLSITYSENNIVITGSRNAFQLNENDEVIALSLTNNQISDISFLVNFPKLKTLKLENNQIRDISVIETLTLLNYLELSNNQISNISCLKKLNFLSTLDISNNTISDFSTIENLIQLQSLGLRTLNISNLYFLKDLTNLKYLFLDDNGLSDISPLKDIVNLEILTLNNNKISDLELLKEMSNLSFLVCYHNRISDISFLKGSKIKYLHLGFNQISDMSVVSSLKDLLGLHMQENKISDITPLKKCRKLQSLNLANNNITNLDALDIKLLNGLDSIDLKGNPIQNTTISDFSDLEAIKGFVQSFNKENILIHNRYVKINIIGSGRIGKTQFFNWLLRKKYNSKELETHGTGVDFYKTPDGKFSASLWDFGGQSYQHGTHSLFLRPNDFYIVLYRSSNDTHGYTYWIGAARNFASVRTERYQSTPLMVVQSVWSSENDKLIYISSEKVDNYELDAVSIFHVDVCEFQKKSTEWESRRAFFIDSLNSLIINHAKSFGKIPRKFSLIRGKMEKSPFGIYMRKEDFKSEFASKYNTSDFAYLLQYLEFTGAIIYFREKPLLEDYIFTNPRDLSDWIYKTVLNKVFQKDNMGVLSFQQLVQDFGEDKAKIFKELMLEFNLLFVEPEFDLEVTENLVIPQFLPENNSTLKKVLLELIPFTFSIRFEDFIYEGRIFNFISKYGAYAEDKSAYWKYGILFNYNGIRTIVYYDIINRTVYVHLENNKKSIHLAQEILDFFILKQIADQGREELMESNEIKKGFSSGLIKSIRNSNKTQKNSRTNAFSERFNKLRYDLITETLKQEGRELKSDNIIIGSQLSTNNENYIDIIEALKEDNKSLNVGFCVKHKKNIQLDYLTIKLLGMEDKKLPKVFISYSRKDLEYKDKLRSHLSVLERYDLVKAWSCDQMTAGKWHKQIQQELEDADIIIYMVSHNFMSSDYIMDEEVKKGIRMAEEDPGKKIICVVVGVCQWQNWASLESKYKEKTPGPDFLSADLSQFQFLPYHQYRDTDGTAKKEEIVALEKWGRYHYDVENEAYNQIVGRIMKEIK